MSDVSPAQQAANQANAQHSRGPVSEAGKRRSSLNAIRHGLSGRTVVLPNEDVNLYQSFCQELMAELAPKSSLERELAQTVIDQQWRLNRIRTVEDGMYALHQFDSSAGFNTGSPETDATLKAAHSFRFDSNAFIHITIYEQRIHRLQREALKQLRDLQAERKAREQAELEEAIRLQKLHEMQDQQWDPQENGFVYSSQEIHRESTRRSLREAAKTAEKVNFNLAEFRARMERRDEKAAA
jgi:hypothetical protein